MREVGIRLKAGVEGQDQVGKLTKDLDAAGQAAAQLDTKSDGLAAAQQRVGQQVTQTRSAVDQLGGGYREVAKAAATAASQQSQSAEQARSGLESLSRQLGVVRNLASAAIGGQLFTGLIGDVTKTTEAYANLAARIKLVTGEGAAFDSAFQGVFDVAKRTNTALEATGNLFARLAEAGKSAGLSTQAASTQALALAETINQAVQLSGASAEASNAAVTQLIQGLQSGVLRGDEFNSVMEQAPRLAKALADGLGVTTGELRKMAEAGSLSADTVIGALKGQSAAVQREFATLPPTVGRALQNLSTEWIRYVGEVDKANGISTAAAKAIGLLAGHLDTLGSLLSGAGKAAAAFAAIKLADVFMAKAAAAKAAAIELAAETAATTANSAAAAANATAKRAQAAAAAQAGAAAGAEAVAVSAETTALAANTVAARANAAAKGAAAGAATAAAAGLGAVAQAAPAAAAGLAATGAAASASVGGFAAARIAGLRMVGMLGAIGAAVAGVSLAWDAVKAVGGWIGEGIAKLQGYKGSVDDLAAAQKAAAEDAQRAAKAQAELAQQTARAAEQALGLNDASRKVLADFDDLRTKGTSAGEALQKLAKDMDLGTPQGITNAVTALDALERKGKVTGEAVRGALAQALDGKDLLIFETLAKTSFDNSDQGARRLKLTLDAIADESLRRAGTSAAELQTGFSAAMNKAMNDTDALDKTLKRLGVTGAAAGQLLDKSINKEIEAANTERALQRVQDRLIELGKQGKLSGDQVAEGLDKVRAKADEIKPGINSVGEAAKALGIKTREELEQTANRFKQAWDVMANSTKVTLQEKIAAFAKYREAAIAANGGVESSEVALQRQTLESQAKVAGLGEAFTSAMSKANTAVDDTKKKLNEWGEEVNAAGERINQLAAGFQHAFATARSVLQSTKYDAEKFALGADGQRFAASNGTMDPLAAKKEATDAQGKFDAALKASNLANDKVQNYGKYFLLTGVTPTVTAERKAALQQEAIAAFEALQTAQQERDAAVAASAAAAASAKAGKAAAAPANTPPAVNSTYTVNLNLTGRAGTTIGVSSAADAERLRAWLGQLEADAQRAGG